MKIKNVDSMQGEAVISFNRSEIGKLCNGLYLLSKYESSQYKCGKDLYTQMRVITDILDYGAVDDFTFNTAVEGDDKK